MKEALKQFLIDQGVMDVNSKQHSYMVLKRIVDELYMEDISKCTEDVCAITMQVKEALSPQDIQELTEVSEDLCYYISQARAQGLSNELLEKVRHYFNHAFYSLEFQGDIAPIGIVMGRFTTLINEYRGSLMELTDNQIDLVSGFVNDFKRWVQLTYSEGKPTDGLENSILSGFEQIEAMVNPKEEESEIEFF